jgi:tol-pal system beta propeller repeat protein TolB
MRPFIVIAVIATALACTLVLGTGSGHATYPGTADGRIAFAMEVDPSGATPDIYSVMPNGQSLHRLTADPNADICQSYSADGKEMAFCRGSEATGVYEIWTMKENGKQQEQVTTLGLRSLFPDFSPDGERIVFMSGSFANFDIYVVDRSTGQLTRLTDSPGLDGFPVYSPDGSKIAFVSARSGRPQVWVMNADGSDPAQLTTDPAPKGQVPDWSPDGSRIAYQSMATGNGDIYVMNADGSNQTRLTFTAQNEFGTSWSPDGGQIAFVRTLGTAVTERAIFVMNADGSGEYELAPGTRVPAWQPRGDRLN